MQLQGRFLRAGMHGDDVALLQRELGLLGFTIPGDEIEQQLFDQGTRQAVLAFQRQHLQQGLEPSGVVDERTAAAINAEVDALPLRQFGVRGQARQADGTPAAGLVVRAFDEDPQHGEVALGEAATSTGGAYAISYTSRDFDDRQGQRPGPDLLVRGLDAQGMVVATSPVVAGARPAETVDLVVEPAPERPFLVQGRVVQVDGPAVVGGLVRAFDRDLRAEELLGEAITDDQGGYQIRYGRDQFGRAETISADLAVHADLLVRAYGADGSAVATSPILFNAGPEETIDLVVGGEVFRGPSEYEQLVTDLTPLVEGLSFAALTEDEEHQDVTFLAGETGQNPQRILLLIKAHRVLEQAGLPAEVCYGLFREGLPTELAALLAQSPDVQRRALLSAVGDNIIPRRFGAQIDSILAQLKAAITGQVLAEPPQPDRATLGQLIGTVLPAEEQRAAFVSAYVDHSGPIAEFWSGLRARPEFAGRVEELQLALQLGALTANHLPLVRELQRMKQAGELSGLSDLARLGEDDWAELITRQSNGSAIGVPPDVPGNDDQERTRNYARTMARMVEDAFPTAFATHRLAADDLPGQADLLTFLKANPGFDVKSTRLRGYLADNPAALDGVIEVDATTTRLQAMQRLYKLTPRYTAVSALLKDGLDSAQRIARMSRNTFLATYIDRLGGQAPAAMAYEAAQQAHAMALNLAMTYGPIGSHTSTQAAPDQAVLEVDGVPEWSTLFGSLELCGCAQCRSVHGPAAYLVDVLHFLTDRSKPLGRSPKEVLFSRRPDLGEIELTCENTNTPVPYVDLVLEALENAVAPPPAFAPFDLAAELEADLDSRTLSDGLKAAFQPPLSDQAVITVGGQASSSTQGEPWWTIDELACTYTIRKQSGGGLRVVARGLQTKGSAAERAANPQYVNANAYDRLRGRVYPWSLPLDLWWEEARAYLGQLGVPREQIMDAFLPGQRTPTPDAAGVARQAALAREYLGLTAQEARIITGATTSDPNAAEPGPWNLWGLERPTLDAQNSIPDPSSGSTRIASGTWLEKIAGRVDVFLRQSGLAYTELLDLLETRFVNPLVGEARAIQLVGPPADPATCETSRLRLDGLDEAAAGRAVRFVRLWRALGWSMRDLDLALLAFGASEPTQAHIRPVLDEQVLICLADVKRLAEALNRPVPRLLAWWAGNLSQQQHRHQWWTTAYVDHQAEDQPEVASLYARLFRDRAVIDPPDPAFTEDPAGLAGPLSEHEAAITAALGISAADLALLLGSSQVVPEATLSLDRLASLHGHASLAKAVRLKVRDYLAALALLDATPLASTADTLRFVEQAGMVRGSGLALAELDYLLRHRTDPQTPIAPTEEAIAVVLAELRAGLQQIAADNTVNDDPDGELTRKKLALLNWDATLIAQAIATLDGTAVHETPLNALPEGLTLPNATGSEEVKLNADFTVPAELHGAVSHEARFLFSVDSRSAGELDQGQLSADLRQQFQNHAHPLSDNASVEVSSPGGAWRIVDGTVRYSVVAAGSLLAVRDDTDKTLKATRLLTPPEQELLRAAADATVSAAVEALLHAQDELRGEIAYDQARRVLRFTGPMTNARKARLDAVPNAGLAYQAYRAAVQALYEGPRQFLAGQLSGFAVRDFSQPLDALPGKFKIPAALKGRAYFDATTGQLHFLGPMTEQAHKTLLGAAQGDAKYRDAVDQLYTKTTTPPPQPGDTFLTKADAQQFFDQPVAPADRFRLVLERLLPYLQRTLSERLAVERMAEALQLEHRSADALLRTWLVSPADPQRSCLDELLDPVFADSSTNVQPTAAGFPAQFQTFRRAHKAALLAAKLGLTYQQLTWLFTYGPALGWLDPNELPTEPGGAAAAFKGWLRLAALARLRDSLPQGEDALDDLLARAQAGTAAATDADTDAAKQAWIKALAAWTRWPMSGLATLLGDASDHTKTGKLDVAFPAGYVGERLLVRLGECFGLLKRTGMSAALCSALADPDVFDPTNPDPAVAQDTARQVRQAVRAGYDEAQWLSLAKPLRDVLRERQRAALVADLVAHLRLPLPILAWPHPVLQLDLTDPVTGLAVKELQRKLNLAGDIAPVPVTATFGQATHDAVIAFQTARGLAVTGVVDAATWAELDQVRRSPTDANDLYAHFLLDVEMDPCMMTSRIKQAISSTQLFVQRCLMNLEPEVLATTELDEGWQQWNWMKNYRVWEANRKVFLYPENWIEPELRDDKSPFFKELESELLQSDLTLETAETAFLHYLEKLDQVARLEIVGTHHQLETDDAGNVTVDILHVFGRTPGIPHVYYYRQWVDRRYWTAWERVDVDIEGDHLLPVVWNRRLHLFWPVFTEQAEPLDVSFSGGELRGAKPHKYWEIKLAWSERKPGKWTNKKLSSVADKWDILSAQDDVPSAFYFRSWVGPQGDLAILVRPRPKLKEKPSHPRMPSGQPHPPARRFVGAFGFDGCHAEPTLGLGSAGSKAGSKVPAPLPLPNLLQQVGNTKVLGMFLEEDPDGSRLLLPAPTDTEALAQTPGTFRLLPHADGTLLSDQPFFYLDNSRTFFVIPSWVTPSIRDWFDPAAVDPEFLLRLPEAYWRQPRALSPSIGPTDNPGGTASLAPASPVELDVAAVGAADLVAIRLDGLDGGAAPRTTAAAGVPTPAFTSFLRGTPTGTRPVLKFRAETRYQFLTHYHPYVCAFVRQLNQAGIDGLLQRKVQMAPWGFLPPLPSGVTPGPLDFETTYQPQQVSHPIVTQPYPRESVEFEYGGAYALYNWELFFHAPLLIADRLMKNQRFEEAQHWLHYIFKPTDTSSTDAIPNRYWQTKPFYQTAADDYPRQRIQQILQLLAAGGDPARRATLSPTEQAELDRQEKAIRDWREKPFQPHLVARLRTVAYQKTVVMKYLDNLIAWADQLFRRDTIESINEATQLYILAAELLGRRPHDVPPRAMPRVQTYNSLEPTLDEFSNALVQIEEFLSPSAGGVVAPGDQPTLSLPAMMYFCVPQNQKLLGYWDTVADRLFKIRHCMNIEGVVRQLPLFEPPIDPGLLVRATAAGVDLSSVLNDASAVQPHYRFQVLAQKASELCAELKSLGSVFLATLEKRDAEELALLRAQHESTMLKLIEQVKQQQYDEAVANQQALRASRQVAAARYLHYQQLLGVQSPQVPGEGQPVPLQAPSALASIMDVAGVKMIPFEAAELASLTASHMFQSIASGDDVAASIAHAIPNFNLEFWGLGTTYGGSNVGAAISAFSGFHKAIASQFGFAATMSSKLAQYVMRAHEWTLQSNLAAREIMQIDRQLTAAEIRRQIAQKELDNQRTQIDHAKQVEAFLRDKYTNQELYGWMLGQVSGVYFQSYQLAYDVAKRAELAYRHELGLTDSSFVQFGYWDSLKKGLLAGERLYHDVKRMEVAYLDHNRREYEITKHVSVSQLDPLALLQLKQRGECQVRIPEALFDLDYPGHFMRRLKSVSVTIPCVTGPYTSVNCTLTLLKSSVRHASTLLGGKYARDLDNDDPRFTGSSGAIQVIVTSDARNDSGLFEPNLRDDRYLPFEGAGAISEWHLELPSDFRAFDYDTVSDVVLHLRYTARAAGGALKQQAATELRTAIDELLRTEGHGLARPFSLRHEFPSEWHRFLNPSDGAAPQALTVALTKDRFPYLFQARTITIQDIELFVKIKPDFRATHNESELRLSLQPGAVASTTPLQGRLMPWNGLLHTKAPASALGEWTLAAWLGDQPQRLDPAAVEDIVLVCNYACS